MSSSPDREYMHELYFLELKEDMISRNYSDKDDEEKLVNGGPTMPTAIERLYDHPENAKDIITSLRPTLAKRAMRKTEGSGSRMESLLFEALVDGAPDMVPYMLDTWHEVNTHPEVMIDAMISVGKKHPDILRMGVGAMRAWKGSEGRTAVQHVLQEGVKAALGGDFTLLDIALEQGEMVKSAQFEERLETHSHLSSTKLKGNAIMLVVVETANRLHSHKFNSRFFDEEDRSEKTLERGARALTLLQQHGFCLTSPSVLVHTGSGAWKHATPMGFAALCIEKGWQVAEVVGAAVALATITTQDVRLDEICLDPDLLEILDNSSYLELILKRERLAQLANPEMGREISSTSPRKI